MEIMGAAEIGLRLRLSRSRTYQLVARRDFPAPRWKLQMGQVWDAADVEAWIRERRPDLDADDSE